MAERGEYTLIIPAMKGSRSTDAELPTPRQMRSEFGELTKNGAVSRRHAIKMLSQRYGVSNRTIFATLEEGKNSAE